MHTSIRKNNETVVIINVSNTFSFLFWFEGWYNLKIVTVKYDTCRLINEISTARFGCFYDCINFGKIIVHECKEI